MSVLDAIAVDDSEPEVIEPPTSKVLRVLYMPRQRSNNRTPRQDSRKHKNEQNPDARTRKRQSDEMDTLRKKYEAVKNTLAQVEKENDDLREQCSRMCRQWSEVAKVAQNTSAQFKLNYEQAKNAYADLLAEHDSLRQLTISLQQKAQDMCLLFSSYSVTQCREKRETTV
jgi:predicted RNase H-like nuclease (RuvC/YqgF family)